MPPSLPRSQSARRRSLALLALLCVFSRAAAGFGFDDVDVHAKELAREAYRKPDSTVPKKLRDLGYDQYRDIRFRSERALWHADKLPFEVMFFYRGFIYEDRVRIHEITPGGVREIAFDPAMFDYGKNKLDVNVRDLGFAGFRVHYPLNTPRYKDEVLAFLGATYFRALGTGQRYGLSARALAVDTGLGSGEEFPRFTDFWIRRPEPRARELTIFALLDSPRVTGAYRFTLRPGVTTAVDVHSRLYLRDKVGKLGIAPLTSMFFFGENERSRTEDYRPEVHDSDGLSIHAPTGEWIWRPFLDPKQLLITSFAMSDPAGFGVQQRDRAFTSYQDLEARFELRPSAWVEPRGAWGPGRIELVEIPTPDEANDNIVAFWVPDAPPDPQKPYERDYRLLWQRERETRPPLAWVMQSRRGNGGMMKPDDTLLFVVDFSSPGKGGPGADEGVEAQVSVDANAKLIESNVYRNEVTAGYRVTLRIRRNDDKKAVEMRAALRRAGVPVSETWSYVLPPS